MGDIFIDQSLQLAASRACVDFSLVFAVVEADQDSPGLT